MRVKGVLLEAPDSWGLALCLAVIVNARWTDNRLNGLGLNGEVSNNACVKRRILFQWLPPSGLIHLTTLITIKQSTFSTSFT